MKKYSFILLICLLCTSNITFGLPSDKVDTTLNTTTLKLLKEQQAVSVDVGKDASFSTIKVYFDKKPITLSNRSFTYKGRVYLPLREVGEILGAEIGWNGSNKVAIVETASKRLEMPQGYRKAISYLKNSPSKASTVNVDQTSLDVRTMLYEGKTYLPIRFTAESLGFNVKYDDATSSVYFTTP
ncbi:copper amine oxidase N-terminal domain-containing protein [Niameybacter massiliensis]|uniref:Copper amine oxidase N-terminal domain-containing protein n=1 Tax=Holtiella tumoricola TaxID=3018743 RepID=A0AA42DQ49_9FIRM|nr:MULTISPECIES: copper amine oxidase N-terminal domain-containing protein [Lachnospirales]MDA3732778.1 copper amine oxidase N-terminal domain-containing protein [Holtiella tumoricola]